MKELNQFKKYILEEGTESSKDHYVFPFFQKLFGNKFKKQTDAEGADTYIEGKLLVELKTKYEELYSGFFQALHYAKKGLSYSSICVIANKTICIWNVNKIPDFAYKLSYDADPLKAPNEIGTLLASKLNKAKKNEILKSARFSLLPGHDFEGIFTKDIDISLYEFKNVLKNLESERMQVNSHNFIDTIEFLKFFFDDPLDAIHCFYAIVGYWDTTSPVASDDINNVKGFRL